MPKNINVVKKKAIIPKQQLLLKLSITLKPPYDFQPNANKTFLLAG
jgi:hypothetical protein